MLEGSRAQGWRTRGLLPVARPAHRTVTAIRVLVAGAAGLLLYVGHVAFVPLALALLFGLVLSGPVEFLHRLRVPRSLGATLIMLVFLGLAAGLTDVLAEPAQHWFAEAPHTVRIIGRKIRPIAQFMNRIDELRSSAGSLAAGAHAAAAPAGAPVSGESAPALLLEVTRGA
jgi:predicted PurR-regulated permease PerM